MQYRQYDPNKDTLKVGVPIRLAGREGVVTALQPDARYEALNFKWSDDETPDSIQPKKFPLLEIGEEPLTISKRLKDSLLRESEQAFKKGANGYLVTQEWLDSLEVVD